MLIINDSKFYSISYFTIPQFECSPKMRTRTSAVVITPLRNMNTPFSIINEFKPPYLKSLGNLKPSTEVLMSEAFKNKMFLKTKKHFVSLSNQGDASEKHPNKDKISSC